MEWERKLGDAKADWERKTDTARYQAGKEAGKAEQRIEELTKKIEKMGEKRKIGRFTGTANRQKGAVDTEGRRQHYLELALLTFPESSISFSRLASRLA